MDDDDYLKIPDFLKRKEGEIIPALPEKEIVPVVVEEPPPVIEEGPTHFEKIQRGMRENASELIAELNEQYDAALGYGKKFDVYTFLRAGDVKPAIAKMIIDKFAPQLDEFKRSKTDPELKEAYRGYDTQERQIINSFLQGVIDDTQRWIDNQNAGKGPRKKKVFKIKPAAKVKSLKYQVEDRDLKLISVAPEKIIGAQELWTYNTKYKHLTHYVARSRAGFMVKGTTLQDFDVDNSVTKVVRKPEDILTKVLEKKKKIMDGLKTKVIVPTGRINSNTILLRIS